MKQFILKNHEKGTQFAIIELNIRDAELPYICLFMQMVDALQGVLLFL